MISVPVYVGLDYHDASVQVCVMQSSGIILGNRSCSNRGEEIVAYVEQFGSVVRTGKGSGFICRNGPPGALHK